jgi:hypothetical protein
MKYARIRVPRLSDAERRFACVDLLSSYVSGAMRSVVPTEGGWLIARLFVVLGRLLSVNPLHLLGKDAPAGRHFFERSFY